MTDLLPPKNLADLFASFTHTAFRIEARDFYDVDSEHEPLRRFLAGEPADDSWITGFCTKVAKWTAEGKQLRRVRVVTVPHSDYVRWSMTVARRNIEAGEDIRYLPRADAAKLEIPEEDYWLFDSKRAAVLRFDDADRLLGFELIEDPAEVLQRCQRRDLAWKHATRSTQTASSRIRDSSAGPHDSIHSPGSVTPSRLRIARKRLLTFSIRCSRGSDPVATTTSVGDSGASDFGLSTESHDKARMTRTSACRRS